MGYPAGLRLQVILWYKIFTMKRLFTLMLASVITMGMAQAQQASRLVRVANMRDNGQGMLPVDSSHVIYKDNSRGINGTEYQYIQYLEGKTSCDTIVGFAYLSGNWQTGMHYQMTYDANGRLAMHHWLTPSGTGGALVSYQRVSFTRDGAGNITKELREQWNKNSNAWENYSQKLNEYTNNNLTKQTVQQWYNNAWANAQVAEYTWNGGLRTEYYFTSWNHMTGALYGKNKSVFSYNGSGHFIQVLVQDYDNNSSTYKDKSREVHTVDASGNILRTLSQTWNNGTWEDNSDLRFTYDSKGQNVRDTFEQWDATNNVWKPSLTYEYTYDDSGNNLDYILQLWDADSVKYIPSQKISQDWNSYNQLTRYHTYRWNKTTQVWEQVVGDYNNRYYYELYTPVPGSVRTQQMAADIKLYPIPARDVITLKISLEMQQDFTVRITDMQGSVVATWKENAAKNYTKQIPLHGLPNGNYLVTVNDGANSVTKQFSVVR